MDKPRGGSDNVDNVFVEFRHFLMLVGHFNTYLVVFSLYLAVIRRRKKWKKE